jgi:hypothetical protein
MSPHLLKILVSSHLVYCGGISGKSKYVSAYPAHHEKEMRDPYLKNRPSCVSVRVIHEIHFFVGEVELKNELAK